MNIRFMIYIILNVVIFLEFLYIGYTNFTAIVTQNPTLNQTELYYLILSICVLSFVIGVYIKTFQSIKLEKKLLEYRRELEKRGIDKDESSSRVRVLESKIEVLEKALKEALGK